MKDLYQDLAEYTNRDYNLVKARCQIANIEAAWLWEKYKDNPIEFYRDIDLYLFNLTYYQSRLQKSKIPIWYQYMIDQHRWKTGLDIGGGIGEQTILAMEKGVDMVFTEVRRSHTIKYALWRFDKYGVCPHTEGEDYKIEHDFDFIVAMDVLEHMENPQDVIQDIALHTKWLFCNPEQIKYNWVVPQHISKFSLDLYFKHEDLYLWRRK